MLWRANGVSRCPRCGGVMEYFIEAEGVNGRRTVRHLLRCRSCSYREVLQEVRVYRSPQGILVARVK